MAEQTTKHMLSECIVNRAHVIFIFASAYDHCGAVAELQVKLNYAKLQLPEKLHIILTRSSTLYFIKNR